VAKKSDGQLQCEVCGNPVLERAVRPGGVRCARCRRKKLTPDANYIPAWKSNWAPPINDTAPRTEDEVQRLVEDLAKSGLKLDHVKKCRRCGKAGDHLVKLDMSQRDWAKDEHLKALCQPADGYVSQDYVAQQELPAGDSLSDSKLTRISDVRNSTTFTTNGGRRIPSGTDLDHDNNHLAGDRDRGAPGHQGVGVDPVFNLPQRERGWKREARRQAKARGEEQAQRSIDTALDERRRAWMTADRGSSTPRQQEAYHLAVVLALGPSEAARRMGVSEGRVRALLKDFTKNAG
jgi:hypothetical protein